jgi:hypothetical protein
VSPRHLVPPAFVAALGGSVVLAGLTRRAAWLAPVTVPYFAATAANAWRTAQETGVAPLSVGIATTVLHLSYGAGAISGVLHLRSEGHPPPPAIARDGPPAQAAGSQT